MSRFWTSTLDLFVNLTSSSILKKHILYLMNFCWVERCRWERKVQNAIRIQFKLFQETSKKAVLNQIEQADKFQEEEIVELALKDIGLI